MHCKMRFSLCPHYRFKMSYSSRSSSRPSDCKVYVGDLGNGAAKGELERAFSYYGPLRSVWVARNPPGFAFVEYEDARDAEDAVKGMDGKWVYLSSTCLHFPWCYCCTFNTLTSSGSSDPQGWVSAVYHCFSAHKGPNIMAFSWMQVICSPVTLCNKTGFEKQGKYEWSELHKFLWHWTFGLIVDQIKLLTFWSMIL